MKNKCFIIIITTIILISIFYLSAYSNIPMGVFNRVLFVRYNNHFGSAFTIEIEDQQYIITARHIANNINEKDKISIYYNSKWQEINVTSLLFDDPNFDVLVLLPNTQVTPKTNVKFSMGGLILSQDVYFLGFPHGLAGDIGDLDYDYPLPFIKKGICSLIDFSEKDFVKIWIDGLSNPGFSGGPIVFKDLSDGVYKIAGVLKGYLNENIKVYSRINTTQIEESDYYIKANSGIILGISIDSVIKRITELIEKENDM